MILIFKKLKLNKTWDTYITQAKTQNTQAEIQAYGRKISDF